MQRHPEDVTSRFSHKGLEKIMQDSMALGSPQDLFRGACSRSHKDLLDDFIRISTGGPAQISTRPLHKELCKIMQGPLGKDFTRTITRSSHNDMYQVMQGPLRKDVARMYTRSSHKDNRFCVSLRSRIAYGHMDMSRVKCRRPKLGRPFCASLRSRNAHGHVTRAHSM